MSEMLKKDALLNFIERLNVYQIVYQQPFLTLYPEWFKEVSIDLENEIHENLLIANIQKESYLNYVKRRISSEIPFENNEETLEKWKETYNLEDLIFPYLDNQEIKIRIASSLDAEYLNQKEKQRCKEMQIDFYCHYAMLKKHEMIHFIDDLLKTDSNKSYKNQVWFKVGLLFAKGKVQKLYHKYKSESGHFKKITLELGFKESDRPYFSETINNSTDNPKNIYRDLNKMKKIHNHCEKNEILMCEDFTKIFKELQTK